MENTLYIALSRQVALNRQMDVVANNLANMDTHGFKREAVLFQEYLVKGEESQKLSYVWDFAVNRDFTAGPVEMSGNPLDVAINGEGFLVVGTDDGDRYTRAGNLKLDADGQLTAGSGHPVLDTSGAPIILSETDGAIEISKDGTVSTKSGPAGQLQLVNFEDPQQLIPVANGLYRTDQDPTPATEVELVQGAVENSNVRPIIEINNMLHVLRSYQSTQRMIETDHDLQRRAIERLASLR